MKTKHIAHVTAAVALGLVSTPLTHATPPPLPVFETVQGFQLRPRQPVDTPVRDAEGNFYGTTQGYGAFYGGTVYKVKPDGEIVTLHHFDLPEGVGPNGLTVGPDGNFYGTTFEGGSSNMGTIYRITPSGVFTVLHEFDPAVDGGQSISRLLLGTDGNFYGTTWQGGANGLGTFYRVTPAGDLTVLRHWSQDLVGWNSHGDVIQGTDGNFYGTNRSVNVPGQENSGAVYRITPDGTATALATFAGLPDMDSCFPAGLMQASDGNFYGTTYYGGSGQSGTVFKVTPAGALSLLAQFTFSENNLPSGRLVEGDDGLLYGTSFNGGTYGRGTVYKITKTGTVTTLVNFGGQDDSPMFPWAGLLKGPNGSFHGTTYTGGKKGDGTFFQLNKHGKLRVLAPFKVDEPHGPDSTLLQTQDGNLYGTTTRGGWDTSRTIFRMTPDTTLSTAAEMPYDANSAGHYQPAFVEGKKGIIFGTQVQGGENFAGSVFKLTRNDKVRPLFSFDSVDGYVTGGLVMGQDEKLYGVNQYGGTHNVGTVFRMTQKGEYTLMAEFEAESYSRPNPGLIQASDGNFYGTTQSGGFHNNGTVFKMTPTGALSVFAEFGNPDVEGKAGNAGLIQGSDGSFYGLMPWGGPSDSGSIYKVSPGGVVTTLATFEYYGTGARPAGQLTEGPDGAFYGVTSDGGPSDQGTVFRITSAGEFATVFAFDGKHGRKPLAGLTKGNDGALYGTTSEGGVMADGTPAGGGQIYRLRFTESGN